VIQPGEVCKRTRRRGKLRSSRRKGRRSFSKSRRIEE